jgi:hypothetical protein
MFLRVRQRNVLPKENIDSFPSRRFCGLWRAGKILKSKHSWMRITLRAVTMNRCSGRAMTTRFVESMGVYYHTITSNISIITTTRLPRMRFFTSLGVMAWLLVLGGYSHLTPRPNRSDAPPALLPVPRALFPHPPPGFHKTLKSTPLPIPSSNTQA